MKYIKRLLFILPVIAGIILLGIMVKNKNPPVRPEIAERSRPVSVIRVQSTTVVPRVKGYGYVQATETWDAVSQVGGQIIKMHPELKKGTFINKGELLLQIDPESYGLAESRGQASVKSVEAQLKELDQQKANTERLLANEREAMKLTRKELERKRGLAQKGVISQSELEIEEKNLLSQDTLVKNLMNTLALIPSKKKALLAQKDSDESSLGELRLDLERTTIRAPFDCRVSEVKIELNQYAPMGSLLLKLINISEVEIPVQLHPGAFVNLLAQPIAIGELIAGTIDMEKIREIIGISAQVSLPMFNKEAIWEAKFSRTSEAVDLQTGALTVYVAVSKPYEKARPGIRPPLVPNLYCQVELRGQARDNRFVIPLRALHDNAVYLSNEEGRLVKTEVDVEMVMANYAIIRAGLKDNDILVLTDLAPAIEGMLLTPVPDEKVEAEITAFALPL